MQPTFSTQLTEFYFLSLFLHFFFHRNYRRVLCVLRLGTVILECWLPAGGFELSNIRFGDAIEFGHF